MRHIIILLSGLIFFNCNDIEKFDDLDMSLEPSENLFEVVDSTLGFTVRIQDSTLYFSSADELLQAITILRNTPKDVRRSWEESVGFVSAQSQIEDLQDEIKTMDDENKFHELVKNNNELVLVDLDALYGIKARIYGFYPYITSKRGFFVSEKYWGRVFDGKLYSGHFYDDKAYAFMSDLALGKDMGNANVRVLQLDYNEADNLKSYHEVITNTNTKIQLRMNNYAINNPDKRSNFDLEIVNTYGITASGGYKTLSKTETFYEHYFIVYYFGTCCDPSAYTYYYAAFGGVQRFERNPYDNGWRIRVPYAGYFDTHPFSITPNWDDEVYIRESYNVYWYNYFGRADLVANFQAQKRILWNWSDWDGTVVYFKDVVAEIQVGENVYYHSGARSVQVGPFGDNYIDQVEDGTADASNLVYNMVLSEYRSTPPVVFKGCVSGRLYSRFCPDEFYDFSFNY